MPFPFGNHFGSRTGCDRDTARTPDNYWELSEIDTRIGRGTEGADNAGESSAERIICRDGILGKHKCLEKLRQRRYFDSRSAQKCLIRFSIKSRSPSDIRYDVSF